jgi:hypothetical protein
LSSGDNRVAQEQSVKARKSAMMIDLVLITLKFIGCLSLQIYLPLDFSKFLGVKIDLSIKIVDEIGVNFVCESNKLLPLQPFYNKLIL